MSKIWVKALTTLNTEDEFGKLKQVPPGDWCEVGKQQARVWLANKQCEILDLKLRSNIFSLDHCGAILLGDRRHEAHQTIIQHYGDVINVDVSEEEISLKYPRTLIWDTSARLRPELITIGFGRLSQGWQVAIPLLDYDILAQDIGGQTERNQTKRLTHDLRIPVYDSRVLFVRRCSDTEKFFNLWYNDSGNERNLALLRALYQVKPIINALPVSWTK